MVKIILVDNRKENEIAKFSPCAAQNDVSPPKLSPPPSLKVLVVCPLGHRHCVSRYGLQLEMHYVAHKYV